VIPIAAALVNNLNVLNPDKISNMNTRIYLFILLVILGTTASYAQPATAIRLIKIGNTYREANQYKEAERALMSGLGTVRQQRDRYWEAVACENLGLLYRDIEDSLAAIRYLDTAARIYQQLNLEGSRIALVQLAESVRKRAAAYAGIDIGSTGVKLSVIQVTLGKEGHYIYNATKDSAINSNFADLNSSAFESAKDAIRRYFTIINGLKITEDHIYVAFSSGVLQNVMAKNMSKDSISNVFLQVARSIIPSFQRPIEFLTPDMEARYTNIGIVLPKFKEKSVSIDIGGGNTKGGFYTTAGNFESFSLPFGSRFMAIKPNEDSLPQSVRAELMVLNQRAGIQNKREVFFLGGIVWAMINLLYPEKAMSDYVEFSANDVANFQKLASGDYTAFINYTTDKVEKITDPELATRAKKNLNDTQNTFTAENLRRGALLFGGIVNELNIPTLKKRYYFLSKGSHIAWVTGYIVSNITERYRTAKE
jgi:tetratricopeptide (TPR) repeat protein